MKRLFSKPFSDDPENSRNVYDRLFPDPTTSTGFRCVDVAVSNEESDQICAAGGELTPPQQAAFMRTLLRAPARAEEDQE